MTDDAERRAIDKERYPARRRATRGGPLRVAIPFNGVKVFSATLHANRGQLGETVTAWLTSYPDHEIAEIVVTQSSDAAFHCIAITVFFLDPHAGSRSRA